MNETLPHLKSALDTPTTFSLCRPSGTLPLADGEVHIWSVSLDSGAARIRGLWRMLPPDERARARQFRFPRDRARFIVARGMLRVILGRYLHQEPQTLRFRYGPYGKPALAIRPGQVALRINLSHSYGLAVYAVSRRLELGVDVERVRPLSAIEQVAEQVLTPRECSTLRVLPLCDRPLAFFRFWTRGEAYAKARGEGIGSQRRDMLLWRNISEWSIQELVPAPGYVAALAVGGRGWLLKCRTWSEETGNRPSRVSG